MNAATEAVIAAWRPRTVSQEAAAVARMVVAAAAPVSAVRARALLWACGHMAAFAISVGLEPCPETMLHPSVIERFVLVGMARPQ